MDESEIMLQEYIHKKNELCIDGITVNSMNLFIFLSELIIIDFLMIVTGFTIIIHNWIILIWLRR